ncbi:MAG: tetratricopeptide repeat protein [Acidobacteria bacterium]|nr:tetratricopeptide repeat protein [Acidobacteriota bacterium]
MAKQRRPQPRSAKSQTSRATAVPSESGTPSSPVPPSARETTAPAAPARRTNAEAVVLFERALAALQRHEYRDAADLFESILRLHPEEKELQERVRLYLSVCERHATPREASPQTLEERLYASTLALNGGHYDQAIAHLRLVRDEDPDNDHALYMLAVAHAQRGEHAAAIAHLERAIALNPENRGLARRDPDLEPLHGDEAFRQALDAPAPPRGPSSAVRRPLRRLMR